MAQLSVSLSVEAARVRVSWLLSGLTFEAGEVLARQPVSIAGAPTVAVPEAALVARDDLGRLPVAVEFAEGDEGGRVREWRLARGSTGPIEVLHPAEPIDADPLPATPPLELRREGRGLSGALKCLMVMPAAPDDTDFELAVSCPSAWRVATSLGEERVLTGNGLELLGDAYFLAGPLEDAHRRCGAFSVWWLTEPGFDVDRLSGWLATTHGLMKEAFGGEVRPYRVFLRTHGHRGLNASAHPASFVMAVNPRRPLDTTSIAETVAHELVHEWLHLDGPTSEVTWFVEGSADYYALVLLHRAGELDDADFLRAVNLEAREAYANPRGNLALAQANEEFFSDFPAHRLPYARGMFYLADLDARIRAVSAGQRGVDDVVRRVVRERLAGIAVGLPRWFALVQELLPEPEAPIFEAMVERGVGRPRPDSFGAGFDCRVVDVPVLDLGFEFSTLLTHRVQGLVPDGVAARAGLREGDLVDLPRLPELLASAVDDVLCVAVTRGDTAFNADLPLGGSTARVPQWFARA